MTGKYITYPNYSSTAKYLQYQVTYRCTNVEAPNAVTRAAIAEATGIERHDLPTFHSVDELIAEMEI